MLKIGEFSRLSQIGIHALRNYDKIGLLVPEQIDKFTGYRYYTLQQLPRAHRIIALKEMSLSLEQVGIMLNQEMNIDELRGMFRLKQTEVEQRMREEQKRLAMLEFHLHMIELENKMPDLNVVVKEISAFKALYLRFHPVDGQIPRIGEEINQLIADGTIKHTGVHIGAMYGEEINPENYDFAFIVPVTDEQKENVTLSSGEVLALQTIPEVLVATIVVEGHGEPDLLEKQVLLERWAVENGYALCRQHRAIHHKGAMHHVSQSEWVTELQTIIEAKSS